MTHSLNIVTGSSLRNNWIIDTSATCLICSSLNLLYSHHSISPIVINLPNKSYFSSTIFITIKLNDNLTLYNVLFVPEFNCSLISTFQLSSYNKCNLIFDHCSCIIYEQLSFRIIGLAKVYKNLYTLSQEYFFLAFFYNIDVNVTKCNYDAQNKFSLWNHRLGHPSHNVLKTIQQRFSIVCDHVNFVCDCCHYAKQTKCSFPLSNIQTTSSFELIHLDIWGPLTPLSVHGHS